MSSHGRETVAPGMYELGIEFFCHLRRRLRGSHLIPVDGKLDLAMKQAMDEGYGQSLKETLHFGEGTTRWICPELSDMVFVAKEALLLEYGAPGRPFYTFAVSDTGAKRLLERHNVYGKDLEKFTAQVARHLLYDKESPLSTIYL